MRWNSQHFLSYRWACLNVASSWSNAGAFASRQPIEKTLAREAEIEFLNSVMNAYQSCDKPYYPIEIFDTPERPAPTQIEVRRLGDIARSKAVLVSLSVRGWPDHMRRAQLEEELCRVWIDAGLKS